ncbi:MAG: hypothetical protein HQK49_05635 [Oligoflexia bacterium]|nr:hypothetical protein [Oligoflexia bacterium]
MLFKIKFKIKFEIIFFIFTTLISEFAYADDIEIINSQMIESICKGSLPSFNRFYNKKNEYVADIVCKSDQIIISGKDKKHLSLEGKYSKAIQITAENITFGIISCSAAVDAKANAAIVITDNFNILKGVHLIADNLNISTAKINTSEFIARINKKVNNASSMANTSSTINADKIHIWSSVISNGKNSLLSANDISLNFNLELSNNGIIRSNGDIVFQTFAKDSEGEDDVSSLIDNGINSKIFANGVLISKAASINDSSKTIARYGAFYNSPIKVSFQDDYSLETINLLVDSPFVETGKYTKFALENSAVFNNNDLENGTIDFSGTITLATGLDLSNGKTALQKSIEQQTWTRAPVDLISTKHAEIFANLSRGVYLTSVGEVRAKSLTISSEGNVVINGKKFVDIDGDLQSGIANTASTIVNSENAIIKGSITASEKVLIDIINKLELASKIYATDFSAKAKEVFLAENGSIVTKNSATIISKDNLSINGTIKTGIDLFEGKKTLQEVAEVFNKLSAEEQLKYRLVLHSENGDLLLGKNLSMRYLLADFKAKKNISRDGNLQGLYETLEGKDIKEGGEIEVKSSDYKADAIKLTGSYKTIQLKIKDIKSLTFAKGSDTFADTINISQAKDIISENGSRITGATVVLDSDQVKIDGALTALATLGIKGSTLKIAENGNVESKGNTLLESTDYIGIDGSLKSSEQLFLKGKQVVIDGIVAGMGPVVVSGNQRVRINGSIDSNGNTFITTSDLSTTSGSQIKGQNVQLFVEKNIEHNGKIISNQNTLIKLENGDFEKVRGNLSSGGWVAFDGKISSEEAIKLVTTNEGKISAQGIQVITTEPIVINRNIESTSGVAIEAKELEVSSGTSINGTNVNLGSTSGNLTLKAGSTITATNSVTISAKGGDLIREGKIVDGKPFFSTITSGTGGVILETDGTYVDQASQTKTSGTFIIQAKNGLIIVPLEYTTTSQQTKIGFFKNRTITTTSTVYYNTTMEAKNVSITTEAPSDVTNLDFKSDNLVFNIPEGKELPIKRLHNSVSSITTSAWRNGFKPIGRIIDEANRMANDAKKITSNLIKIEQSISRAILKPITNNIPVADKIMERIYKVQNVSSDMMTDLLNVNKIYKTDTYKKCFDGVKDEIVATVNDLQRLKSKVITNVVARALKNVSQDLANLSVKLDKFADKGVGYVEAAASFENVARIALVTVATACGGGPTGAALANVLADKYIAKNKMTVESALKSMATGMAAGYASQFVTNLNISAGNSATSTVTSMSSSVAGNLSSDATNKLLNHSSYTSRDFITSVLTGSTSGAITSNIKIENPSSKSMIIGGLTGASSETIREVVHENRLNLDEVALSALNKFANTTVDSKVSMGVEGVIPESMKSIINLNLKQPLEKKIDLGRKIGSTLQGFKEAMPELIAGLEAINENGDDESVDKIGLSEDQKATLDKFIKEQDAAIKLELAKKFGVDSYDKLTPDQLASKEYQDFNKCHSEQAEKNILSDPGLLAVVDRLKEKYQIVGTEKGREPAYAPLIIAGATGLSLGAKYVYQLYKADQAVEYVKSKQERIELIPLSKRTDQQNYALQLLEQEKIKILSNTTKKSIEDTANPISNASSGLTSIGSNLYGMVNVNTYEDEMKKADRIMHNIDLSDPEKDIYLKKE